MIPKIRMSIVISASKYILLISRLDTFTKHRLNALHTSGIKLARKTTVEEDVRCSKADRFS